MSQLFQNILLLGRPASGKSEFIDFMKQVSDTDRASKYHIGKFKEMDDFPWIWEKFNPSKLARGSLRYMLLSPGETVKSWICPLAWA